MARDPIRRKASREAQNARRRAERAAKALRKQANELEKQRRANWRSSGKDPKGTESLTARRLRNEARQLERFASKTTTTKQTDLNKLQERINELDARVAKAKDPTRASRAQFNFELAAAQSGFNTNTFGSGSAEENRLKVKMFFAFYKNDWQGAAPEDRIDIIMKKHGFSSIQEAVDTAINDDVMKSVYDALHIDTSNIDTNSQEFQSMISMLEEKYEEFKIAFNAAITTEYQKYRISQRSALGL